MGFEVRRGTPGRRKRHGKSRLTPTTDRPIVQRIAARAGQNGPNGPVGRFCGGGGRHVKCLALARPRFAQRVSRAVRHHANRHTRRSPTVPAREPRARACQSAFASTNCITSVRPSSKPASQYARYSRHVRTKTSSKPCARIVWSRASNAPRRRRKVYAQSRPNASDVHATSLARRVQRQTAPAAADFENPHTRAQIERIGDALILRTLCVVERTLKIAVEQRARIDGLPSASSMPAASCVCIHATRSLPSRGPWSRR